MKNQMTILRAQESLEMDVDMTHVTQVANVELDELGNMTIYGTQEGRELYYVVLDHWAVEQIVETYGSQERHYILFYGSKEIGARVERFTGTYRNLLYKLHGAEPDDDAYCFWPSNKGHDKARIGAWSNKDLEECFQEINGTSSPVVMVWSVDEDIQVIGPL